MRQSLAGFRKVSGGKQRRKTCVFTEGVILQPLGGGLWVLFLLPGYLCGAWDHWSDWGPNLAPDFGHPTPFSIIIVGGPLILLGFLFFPEIDTISVSGTRIFVPLPLQEGPKDREK